jgi:hypothetical protein
VVEKENQIHGSALAVNLRGVSTFIQECSRLFLCPSTENKIRQSKSAILAGMLRCLCKIAESATPKQARSNTDSEQCNTTPPPKKYPALQQQTK